jgi:hypothetical protein
MVKELAVEDKGLRPSFRHQAELAAEEPITAAQADRFGIGPGNPGKGAIIPEFGADLDRSSGGLPFPHQQVGGLAKDQDSQAQQDKCKDH